MYKAKSSDGESPSHPHDRERGRGIRGAKQRGREKVPGRGKGRRERGRMGGKEIGRKGGRERVQSCDMFGISGHGSGVSHETCLEFSPPSALTVPTGLA